MNASDAVWKCLNYLTQLFVAHPNKVFNNHIR